LFILESLKSFLIGAIFGTWTKQTVYFEKKTIR
jgi:hypothetical protein